VLKRARIVQRLEAQVRVVRPDGSHCGVLFIDIDRLKQVNDRLGHPAGDELLRILASRIERALPDDAEVGRFGGDEFLLIAAGINHVGLAELAEQVRAALAESTLLDGLAVSPSASIGATLGRAGEDADSLIRRVDGLMYEAKRLGGDGVVVRG
jgi:diguanylate cyclase (GGDEF)-like protein